MASRKDKTFATIPSISQIEGAVKAVE